MVQTTANVPMGCILLEIAREPCAAWTDISGSSQSLSGVDVTRLSGEAYTFDGDVPLISGGKKEPVEIVVEVVYTETDLEAFEFTRTQFEQAGCNPDTCLRWSPRGGSVGDALYTTGEGVLVSFTYPPGDASAGGPILAGFTLKVPWIDTSVVMPS